MLISKYGQARVEQDDFAEWITRIARDNDISTVKLYVACQLVRGAMGEIAGSYDDLVRFAAENEGLIFERIMGGEAVH